MNDLSCEGRNNTEGDIELQCSVITQGCNFSNVNIYTDNQCHANWEFLLKYGYSKETSKAPICFVAGGTD